MNPFEVNFFSSALNSLPDQLAIIEASGVIVFVNNAWKNFAVDNDCHHIEQWVGINYLDVCQQGASNNDEYCTRVLHGMHELIAGRSREFYIEYPCHSPTVQRWFYMRAVKLDYQSSSSYFILTHHDITERVLAEISVADLSLIDHLTGLKNRRAFDQLFEREWRHCLRENTPLSLALLDIDFFKQYNDEYGHLEGDKCLEALASIFRTFEKRSTDFVARYGGEEFIFVLGNTSLKAATQLLTELTGAIKALAIPHKQSSYNRLTVSVGLATVIPSSGFNKKALINKADKLLYEAKDLGRNRMNTQLIHSNIINIYSGS